MTWGQWEAPSHRFCLLSPALCISRGPHLPTRTAAPHPGLTVLFRVSLHQPTGHLMTRSILVYTSPPPTKLSWAWAASDYVPRLIAVRANFLEEARNPGIPPHLQSLSFHFVSCKYIFHPSIHPLNSKASARAPATTISLPAPCISLLAPPCSQGIILPSKR